MLTHVKDPAIGQHARAAINSAIQEARTARSSVGILETVAPVQASRIGHEYTNVQKAIDAAIQRKRPFVFDRDTTIPGDILITQPVHIVLPVGVTVTMAANPVLQHYAETESGHRYAGMFSLRQGAGSSVFEFWGRLVGPSQAQQNETICPIMTYNTDDYAHYMGSPVVSGMIAGRASIMSSTYVTDWGGGVISPLGPFMNIPEGGFVDISK